MWSKSFSVLHAKIFLAYDICEFPPSFSLPQKHSRVIIHGQLANTRSCQCGIRKSGGAIAQMGSGAPPTKGGPRIGPWHRGHDDEAEALVLAAPDLHVVGLYGDGHRGAAPTPPATADAAGAAAAWADRVQGVLAALWRALILRQRRRLRAAVMGGGWRWGHVSFAFRHCWVGTHGQTEEPLLIGRRCIIKHTISRRKD